MTMNETMSYNGNLESYISLESLLLVMTTLTEVEIFRGSEKIYQGLASTALEDFEKDGLLGSIVVTVSAVSEHVQRVKIS